jgi:hypothetical protein
LAARPAGSAFPVPPPKPAWLGAPPNPGESEELSFALSRLSDGRLPQTRPHNLRRWHERTGPRRPSRWPVRHGPLLPGPNTTRIRAHIIQELTAQTIPSPGHPSALELDAAQCAVVLSSGGFACHSACSPGPRIHPGALTLASAARTVPGGPASFTPACPVRCTAISPGAPAILPQSKQRVCQVNESARVARTNAKALGQPSWEELARLGKPRTRHVRQNHTPSTKSPSSPQPKSQAALCGTAAVRGKD